MADTLARMKIPLQLHYLLQLLVCHFLQLQHHVIALRTVAEDDVKISESLLIFLQSLLNYRIILH